MPQIISSVIVPVADRRSERRADVGGNGFSTSHFSQPERLVTHPDKAPRIYVKNPVIRRRHQCNLHSAVFKDEELHPYNPETLTFSNSDGAEQLLEVSARSRNLSMAQRPAGLRFSWLG